MITPMSAADEPRLHACIETQLHLTSLPALHSDAERYAWIALIYKRRIKPGINRAKLVRDIAAFAFEITIEQLLSSSRKRALAVERQKIICLTRLLTGVGPRQLGALFNKNHATIIHACRKFRDEIAPHLREVM